MGTRTTRNPSLDGTRRRSRKPLKILLPLAATLVVLVALAIMPPSASAAARVFYGKAQSGDTSSWLNRYNWSSAGTTQGTLPVAGDTVTFMSNATYKTITYDAALGSILGMTFNGTGWTITPSAGQSLNWRAFSVSNGANVDWGLENTMSAARTITNNGGTLTHSGAIANGGYLLTVTSGTGAISGGTTIFSGGLSGTGGLRKSYLGSTPVLSSGTVRLSGSNTYTGTTTIDTYNTLDVTGSWANQGSTLSLDISGTGTVSGNISGTGGLTKSGAGQLTFSGSNSYGGSTTVSGGTLLATKTGSLPGYLTPDTITVGSNATLSVMASTDWPTGSIDSLRSNVSWTATSYLGLDTTNATNGLYTYASDIDDADMGFAKYGDGTLLLTGANTYSGPTTVYQGTLEADNPAALNGSDDGDPTISTRPGATLAVAAGGAGQWTEGDIDLLMAFTDGYWNESAFFGIDTAGGDFAYTSGGIFGVQGFTKIGANTLDITTAALTYTGATKVTGGTLKISLEDALPTGTDVSMSDVAGAIFDVNGYSQTIATLTGGGANGGDVNLGSGTTGYLNSSFHTGQPVYDGVISGGGSFERSLDGTDDSSSLTLTGVNTFTGPTTLSGGKLRINSEVRLGANPSSSDPDHLYFTGGGILEAYGSFTMSDGNRGITMGDGGGVIDVDDTRTLTVANKLTGSGSLTKADKGTLVLTGANADATAFTGSTSVLGGTLEISSAANLGGDLGSLSADHLTLDAATGETVTLHVTGNVNITDADRGLTIGSEGGTNVINVDDGFKMTQTGDATGSGVLTKSGLGELLIAGATGDYSGTCGVTAGTLRLNGTFDGASTVNVSSGATFAGTGDSNGAVNLSGTIDPGSAAGAVGKLTSGEQTWEGGASYPVQMTSATGGSGTGYDFVDITGPLTCNADSGNKFNITLTGANMSLNTTGNYVWPIVKASTGMSIDLDGINFVYSAWAAAQTGLGGRTPTLRVTTYSDSSQSLDIVLSGDPTSVTVTKFRAYRNKGRVVTSWETASLGNTLGFDLHRKSLANGKWIKVNRSLIPAVFESPAGAKYTLVDQKAPLGKRLTYRLKEIRSHGGARYKTYRVLPRASVVGQGVPLPLADALVVRQGKGQAPSKAQSPAQPAPIVAPLAGSASGERVRIEVATSGLYVLRAGDIATALGLRSSAVTGLIRAGRLALVNQGRQVAVLAAADASALYFYGEALSTPYTNTNVYYLSKGRAAGVKTLAAAPVGTPATTFTERIHFEQDKVAFVGATQDPESDFWMWDYLVGGGDPSGVALHTLTAPGAVAGRSLGISVMGLTNSGAPNEHRVRVSLNGVVLGDVQFSGTAPHSAEFAIPAGTLVAGANEVRVAALKDAGIVRTLVAVDSFDLTYTRTATAVNDQLLLQADAGGALRVDGFTGKPVCILDVTDPLNARQLRASSGGSGAFWVDIAATEGHRYVISTAAGARSPASMTGAPAAGSATGFSGADYLIITAPALRDAAAGLAAYRGGQGLSTAVVTPQDIYADFSYGIPTPHAIRSFIAHALANWSPAPRFVVLVGEGSYDYRDNRGFGDSMVPPLLTSTEYGLVPSDGLLADTNGDGVPDVALGRIPALTPAELTSYVGKVTRYEASFGAWRSKVLFSADGPDGAGAFGADSDDLAALVPAGLSVQKAYIETLGVTAAKASLKGAFTGGSLLINYLGHGGVDRLTTDGLLGVGDVAGLTGTGKEPVFVAMTCNVGNFGIPGYDCLSEVLALKADGGAIAVFSPTAMEQNNDSKQLDAQFLPAFFAADRPALGAVVLSALTAYGSAGGTRTVLASYALLGDPALVVAP